MSKLILVIGGTGAQGLPVIDSLLEPNPDGSASPYSVRVLTRDPNSKRAQDLAAKGCEIVQGTVKDLDSVEKALEGVYGAFVNTDGFTIGEKEETYAALRMFELAKQTGSVKHYVWSSLDYMHKKGDFQAKYRCGHYDGKGRITDFLKSQPSGESGGMVWSVLTSGPYMEMLFGGLFVPSKKDDGTLVFAHPLGDGQIPLIALKDLGFFARYIFDHPNETSARDLEIASHMTSWHELVETVTKVTGRKAVYVPLTVDEYFSHFKNPDVTVAHDEKQSAAPPLATIRQNFTGFWNGWRDGIVKRDMEMLKQIHPGLRSLESWLKEVNYTGERQHLLKNLEDHGPRGFEQRAKI